MPWHPTFVTPASLPFQSAGRFSDAVIDELARYHRESPDEKLFRMNPFRWRAAETGTEESTAVELFLYAAHAGSVGIQLGCHLPDLWSLRPNRGTPCESLDQEHWLRFL